MIIRKCCSRSIGYYNCRLALLKAFINNPGVVTQLAPRPEYSRLGGNVSRFGRLFSTSHTWWFDHLQQRQIDIAILDNEADAGPKLRADEDESPEPAISTPWYLQVETPQRQSRPLLERQRIPELPPDPPPLLKPILHHISTDLGLDDLTVFDLRKIDPPPALGANLLMVLGTARSEKHLHVSAESFCRWLKRTYKLYPHADGLLGRGELKLKLRRKARRARLLSNVGSSESGNMDDGLRTGWICVYVGTIDDGRDMTESFTRQEGYVGFSDGAGGTKVIVQMLTEEKREELDLESFWSRMQQRQARKDDRISKGQEELLIHQQVGQSSSHAKESNSDFPPVVSLSHPKRPTMSFKGVRCYHHGSVQPAEKVVDRDYEGLDASGLEPVIRKPKHASTSGKTGAAPAYPQNIQVEGCQEFFRDTTDLVTLRALVAYLQLLPSQDAIRILGRDANDFDSTTFLSSFYRSYPLFPSAEHWECRLAIICHGIKIGHSGYSKKCLASLACEMQSSLIEIPANIFSLMYKAFLTPNADRTLTYGGRPSIGPRSLRNAVDTLEAMSFRGQSVLTEEICSDLLVAALRVNRYCGNRSNDAPERLRSFLETLPDNPLTLKAHLRIMHACADQRKWSDFEIFWRGFAKAMRPRPKELYLAMFKRVAQRNHQAYAMRILRERVPDMNREKPPVCLDAELAEAVMECLLVAEPNVESMAMDESNSNREWVRLWRHCQQFRRIP